MDFSLIKKHIMFFLTHTQFKKCRNAIQIVPGAKDTKLYMQKVKELIKFYLRRRVCCHPQFRTVQLLGIYRGKERDRAISQQR